MTLMVTGHRKLIPPGFNGNPYPDQSPAVAEWHKKIILSLNAAILDYATKCLDTQTCQRLGLRYPETPNFITGMAIGADQLFSKAVLALRNADIPFQLHAACPFKGQASRWPLKSQKEFYDILRQCSSVTNICEPGYAAYKMQVRNEWMVDRSQHVLAVWDRSQKGGTYNCVQYAIKQKRLIYVLNPQTLKIEDL